MYFFSFSLYFKLGLHADRIIEGCNRVFTSSPQLPHITERFKHLRYVAEALLKQQEKPPEPIVQKCRSTSEEVRFATGMVMKHKRYGYTCVIFGWDVVRLVCIVIVKKTMISGGH